MPTVQNASGCAPVQKGQTNKAISRSAAFVRLRGIPWHAQESDVIQFFSGIEVVPTGVYMALNANGGPSGDAYVQFSRQCDAILAQRRQRHCMGRRYIEIFACQQSDVVAAMHMNTQSSQAAAAETFSVSEAQKSIRRDDWRYQGVVRMRGLPYDTTTSDIAQFFAGLPIAPEGVHLCCTTDKNPSASTDDCAMQSTSAANTSDFLYTS